MSSKQKRAYRCEKKKLLYEKYSLHKKIYLDLNYWIRLNSVAKEQLCDPIFIEIYNLLEKLVSSKIAVCPVSEIIFFELLKQAGQPEFFEIVSLIERFSQNLFIEPEQEIVFLEFESIFISFLNQKSRDVIFDNLWIRPVDILGHKIPNLDFISGNSEHNLDFYKSYLDFAWNTNFSDMIRGSKNIQKKVPENPVKDTATNHLNENNEKHSDEVSSFNSLFDTERRGILDAYIITAWHAFNSALEKSKLTFSHSENVFKKLMLKIVKSNSTVPGFIDVRAGIHTLVRYEHRKYENFNDLYDFQHAFFAVPFFDYFFTERKLSNVLNHKRLNLGERYNCIVEHQPKNVLKSLKHLAELHFA